MRNLETLQCQIVSCDGGEYGSGHQYCVENILDNNDLVYCSKKAQNINIIFRYQSPQPCLNTNFVLLEYTIKIPITGYTAPVRDGLIFVSSSPIPVSITSAFDSYTYQDWLAIEDKRKRRESMIESQLEPCDYFQITDATRRKGYIVKKLVEPVAGRYILLKLLKSFGRTTTMDLQHVSFRGWVGKRAFASQSIQWL